MSTRCGIAIIFAWRCAAAPHSHTVTVAQFASLVETGRGRTDAKKLMRELAEVTLTERLGSDTLAKLFAESPAPGVSAVIEVQAARSEFLPPPPADLVDLPRPDLSEATALVAKAGTYVSQYIKRLPDFMCRQTVLRFDNDAAVPQFSGVRVGDFRFRDVVTRRMNFFERRESVTVEEVNNKPAKVEPSHGLYSFGEFGNVLAMVFSPKSHTRAVFSHWEKLSGQTVAVFVFGIQRDNSMFYVETNRKSDGKSAEITIGVDGAIFINPATGTILRLTLTGTEIPDGYLLRKVREAVDYGPVELGGKSFILPQRSVAESESAIETKPDHNGLRWPAYPVISLNASNYSNYRRYDVQSNVTFGSKNKAHVPEVATAEQTPQVSTAPWLNPVAPEKSSLPQESGNPQPPSPPAAPLLVFSVPALPPFRTADTHEVASAPHPTFQVGLNEVAVPVVVRNRAGEAVDGLTQDDFEVFDRGKLQQITSFAVEHFSVSAQASANVPRSPGDVKNLPRRFVALLFDDFHLTPEQAIRIRNAATSLIQQDHSETIYAVYTVSGDPLVDFTIDRAAVLKAFQRLVSHRERIEQPGCPNMTYDEAYRITQDDSTYLSNAIQEAASACRIPASSAQAAVLVRSRAQTIVTATNVMAKFETSRLLQIVRRMSVLQGDRVLLFVSPGYAEGDDLAGMETISTHAVQSGIVINVLDAKGLAADEMLDASHDSRDAAGGLLPWKRQTFREEDLSDSAAVAAYADETGGRVFENNNDLLAGLEQLTRPPATLYLLAFRAPEHDKRPEFHKLKVRVRGYRADAIHARKGYKSQVRER